MPNNTEKKATAILQGRLGSSRLPGKVLLPLKGKPVMQHVYERILNCRNVDRIIIATSIEAKDDPIAALFENLGALVFRGSESDPLDRYYKAAVHYDVSHVVRVMADCPLVDPEVVDEVVSTYFEGHHDFCCLGGEFPVGLDTTVYSFKALEQCWREARLKSEREHLFPYITSHPELFDIGVCSKEMGHSHLRWTMDHESDYQFLKSVYEALYKPGRVFLSQDVLKLVEKRPQLATINRGISRDEGIKKAVLQEQNSMGEDINQ